MKKVIFSGIQPTGQLHIGNYFGAIANWIKLQDEYDCVFGIVDLHALTEGQDPKKLKQNIFESALDFLACGLDPKKSILMIQSYVPEHSELTWIFNCLTPISKLERVPTFKEKAQQFRQNLNMGLLDYPVLMAADILIYKASVVPVGQDQLPHLELAREIARTFNDKYGQTFPEPQEKITPTPKIMGLNDPTKKMSKSLGAKSYLALADPPEAVKQKIKSAVTAVGNEKEIIKEFIKHTDLLHKIWEQFGQQQKDGIDEIYRKEKDLLNLIRDYGEAKSKSFMAFLNLYMLLYLFASEKDRTDYLTLLKQGTIKFSDFKQLLIDKIINYPPFIEYRKKRTELSKNPENVWKILEQGSQKAQTIARKTLQEVKEKVGLK